MSSSTNAGVSAFDDDQYSPANAFDRVVYFINLVMHHVAGSVLVLMMVITVIDVIGRRFFSSPFPGAIELTEVSLVVLIYFGIGFAQLHGDHVAIDLLYERLGPIGKRILATLAGVVSLTVAVVLAWRMVLYAEVLRAGHYATPVWHIPLYVIAWIAFLGVVAFALALAAGLTRRSSVDEAVTVV